MPHSFPFSRLHRSMLPLAAVLAISLVLPAGLPARAQDSNPLPPPPDDVDQLAFLAGDWAITGQVKTGDQWQDFTGAAHIDWHLGGYALREYVIGSVDGRAVEATALHAYNTQARRWDVAWTDTLLVDGIVQMAAQQQGDQLIAYSRGVGAQWQITLVQTGPDALNWELAYAASVGDTPEPVWKMAYTRQPDDSAQAAIRESVEPVPPPPETDQFAFWVGDWDLLSKQRRSGDNWQEFDATDSVFWIMNQHALEEYWVGETLSGPIEAWSLTKYNNAESQWENLWWSTVGGFFFSTGECAAAECTLGKATFHDITPDGFVWEFTGQDGNPGWIMDYTRQPAPAESDMMQ